VKLGDHKVGKGRKPGEKEIHEGKENCYIVLVNDEKKTIKEESLFF
jgi:hypothetical protein